MADFYPYTPAGEYISRGFIAGRTLADQEAAQAAQQAIAQQEMALRTRAQGETERSNTAEEDYRNRYLGFQQTSEQARRQEEALRANQNFLMQLMNLQARRNEFAQQNQYNWFNLGIGQHY